MSPRVVLHWDALGIFHFLAEAGVEVICVDERAGEDRVYRTPGDNAPDVLDAVIAGQDPVDMARGVLS